MSMVENFVAEIYRKLKGNQVAIIIDRNGMDKGFLPLLPKIREKIKELGDVRVAEVIYENKIPKKEFEYLRQSGFKDIIVPGNVELSFLLETYDLALQEKVDFVVLGTNRDELIPLYTELRKSVTVFALVDDINNVSTAFVESFDAIIQIDKIDEFVFNAPQFSEIDQILQSASDTNGSDNDLVSDYTGSIDAVVDETNIGTFSEDIIEDDQLIEEMKKEDKSKK